MKKKKLQPEREKRIKEGIQLFYVGDITSDQLFEEFQKILAHSKVETIALLRKEVTQLAIKGNKDPQELKGALLYSRLLKLLK